MQKLCVCAALATAPAAAQSSAGWMIDTFAGSGQNAGDIGDGGPAVEARLRIPKGAALDAAGNLYIADTSNGRIRKVDAAGMIAAVAGNGEDGYGGDGGPATAARLGSPEGAALDGAGNLYIADTSNRRIRKVDAAGVITTVAGNGDLFGVSIDRGDGGPATAANLNLPADIAVDAAGNLYIADTQNQRIRKVDAAGMITTIAGNGEFGYSGDGGPAAEAQLNFPSGIALDGAGNLYIADTNNQRIRKVDAAGVMTTIAGNGEQGFSGDGGPATAARLNHPEGAAADTAGNLYIADTGNGRIRRVDPAGNITAIAGNGQFSGDIGDGGPAVEARLFFPSGIAADAAGNLYVADTFNERIRILTPPPGNVPAISAGGVVLASGTPVVKRISANALISVFGQDFALPGTQARVPALDAEGRLTTSLAGVCVEIGGRRAPLLAVFPHQINAQVPHDPTPGQTAIEVVRSCGRGNAQRSAAEAVAVDAVSPAFFSFVVNPDGRNPAAALHEGGISPIGTPGLLPGAAFTPAEPGEIVSLFGTGFGETEPRLEAGRIAGGDLVNAVALTIGGIAVPPGDVFYAGATPCCAGLYQFNVRLPGGLPDGDAPVIATVLGVSTPSGPFLAVRRR